MISHSEMRVSKQQLANLLFATSQLRYFEKELNSDQSNEELKCIVFRWQQKVDEMLYILQITEYMSREELIEFIQL